MREIKFRAWDFQRKRMLQNGSFTISLSDLGYTAILFHFINEDSSCLIQGRDPIGKTDRQCEIMQYTGMKDKNGKEIYEGDIVCAKWKDELDYDEYEDSRPTSGEWKGEVCFDKSFYVIKQLNDDYSPNISNLCIVSMEIIGNIFENPELVKK